MSDSYPDAELMVKFCREILPALLSDCGVGQDAAEAIGIDVLARGGAFAALEQEAKDILTAPYIEEIFDHKPDDVDLDLLAAVTLVVRNSLLEEEHSNGPVDAADIRGITTLAAGPLSHLLASRSRDPIHAPENSPFAGLEKSYPRAWACLRALVGTIMTGGRSGYKSPQAPQPSMPDASEHVEAKRSETDSRSVVFSGIDPRFDQHLIDMIKTVIEHRIPLRVTALSRISRNTDKQLRVLEILLANRVTILTTNYMLRHSDVWVRRDGLVKANSRDALSGLRDFRGLTGAHHGIARQVAAEVARG